jgi:hypothetical protein
MPGSLCCAGLALMAAGFAWAAADHAATPYAALAGQMALLGVGLGLVSASATEVVMASISSDRLGLASSLNDTARELGGTLGVAAMGSVFNAIYREDVRAAFADSPLPEQARSLARQSLGAAFEVASRVGEIAGPAAASKVTAPAIDAFVAGFHASSLVAAGLAALGAAVVPFLMREPRCDGCRAAGTARTPADPLAGTQP